MSSHASALRLSSPPPAPPIGFFSNHARVLALVASEPSPRLREVAARIGITERAVQRIVKDLEREGLLLRTREGRRNRYVVRRDAPLPHPLERHRSAGAFLDLALEPGAPHREAPGSEPRSAHQGARPPRDEDGIPEYAIASLTVQRREDSFID